MAHTEHRYFNMNIIKGAGKSGSYSPYYRRLIILYEYPNIDKENYNAAPRYYFNLPEYKERLGILRENLRMLDRNYPEYTFCIENDYPCFSFGSLVGDFVSQFDHSICLDIGHLFASCVLFKLDFLEEARKILETKDVKCVHFHASLLVFRPISPFAYSDLHKYT